MDLDCTCCFCNHSGIDIKGQINHPIPICGYSKIDNKFISMVWYGGRRGYVETGTQRFDDIISVCTRLMIDRSELYLRDINCGCIPINSIKRKLMWTDDADTDTDMGTTGICTGEWVPVDVSTLLMLCPEYQSMFRIDNSKKRSNIAKDSIEVDGFDPHTTRPCYWTSENLSKFLRRNDRSLSVHLDPVLEKIVDVELDLNAAPKYKCVFLHSDGTLVELWMPFGDLCLNKSYLAVWKQYKKQESAVATSWDSFNESAE